MLDSIKGCIDGIYVTEVRGRTHGLLDGCYNGWDNVLAVLAILRKSIVLGMASHEDGSTCRGTGEQLMAIATSNQVVASRFDMSECGGLRHDSNKSGC